MVLSIFIRNHTPLPRVSHFLILVQPATSFIWAKVSPKMYRNNLLERSQWRKPLVDMDFMGNNLLLLTICVPSKSWACGWGGQRTCCLCTPVGFRWNHPGSQGCSCCRRCPLASTSPLVQTFGLPHSPGWVRLEVRFATWKTDVDELRVCCKEWIKSEGEKQISYINTCMWNLEKWCRWTYLPRRKRDTDTESEHVDSWGKGRVGQIGNLLYNAGSSAWCSVMT